MLGTGYKWACWNCGGEFASGYEWAKHDCPNAATATPGPKEPLRADAANFSARVVHGWGWADDPAPRPGPGQPAAG